MTIGTAQISLQEARRIIALSEGQYSDVKAIEISPASLTKTMSAFANSDGGELCVGIDEDKWVPSLWCAGLGRGL